MKILITGATGLIGSRLTELACSRGMAVHFLTTSQSGLGQLNGATGFLWDPSSGKVDEKAFEGVEAVVHLAGASIAKRWTKGYKQVIYNSRVDTGDLLFDTLSRISHGVKHFISASGVAYYPPSLTASYDESYTGADDSFLGSVVEAWEDAALRFEELSINVSVVRTGLVLSAQDGALPQIARPVKLGLGAPLGSGRQWQSWVHLDDVAAIYLFLLEGGLTGIFNATAPRPVTNAQLTREIAKRLRRPLWLPNVPAFVLKAVLGEMSTLLLDGQKVLPKRVSAAGFNFRHPDIQEALVDLYP